MSKPSNKDDKKKSEPPPSINTLILRKLISLYESYCKHVGSSTCADVIKALKGILEDDGFLTKVNPLFSWIDNFYSLFSSVNFLRKLIARPTPKDSKLEEKFLKQIQQAEQESNFELVKELRAAYQNPPKVGLTSK